MRTALAARRQTGPAGKVAIETTLLDLVRAVSDATDDDREVVRTVIQMLRSGSVRLCGTFRDSPIDEF